MVLRCLRFFKSHHWHPSGGYPPVISNPSCSSLFSSLQLPLLRGQPSAAFPCSVDHTVHSFLDSYRLVSDSAHLTLDFSSKPVSRSRDKTVPAEAILWLNSRIQRYNAPSPDQIHSDAVCFNYPHGLHMLTLPTSATAVIQTIGPNKSISCLPCLC